jgi:Domain of unknown function (DUF4397)
MRRILLAIVAVTVGFTSCKKKESPAPTTASVMFVNGCAGAVNLDAFVNNTKLNEASNIAFLKNSGYKQVTAASGVNIVFSLTGQGTPLMNGTESLTIGKNYSAFGAGLVNNNAFVFTTDDLTVPSAGKAKVRFINLSADNLNTDCYVAGVKLDSNITYKTCTPFVEVNPGTALKILMVDKVNASYSGELLGQTLAVGKIYTFMLTGTSAVGASGSSVLTLTMIGNN